MSQFLLLVETKKREITRKRTDPNPSLYKNETRVKRIASLLSVKRAAEPIVP